VPSLPGGFLGNLAAALCGKRDGARLSALEAAEPPERDGGRILFAPSFIFRLPEDLAQGGERDLVAEGTFRA
jgi:hypothetical protein